MAIDLDGILQNVAKTVVADLGDALDTTITYTRKADETYDITTGGLTTTDTTYADIKAPVEFVVADDEGVESGRAAKVYVSPSTIGNNRPTLQDEVTLTYAGAARVAQIVDIRTLRGKQKYLYILRVVF